MSTARVKCVFKSRVKVDVWTESHPRSWSVRALKVIGPATDVINSAIQIARLRAQSMVFVGK